MTDTATILRKARDHIAQPGMWFRGHFSPRGLAGARSGEPCCAFGAMEWAFAHLETSRGAEDRALDFFHNALPKPFLNAAQFNDTPGRTQAEVVALFDHAIELAEKEATA